MTGRRDAGALPIGRACSPLGRGGAARPAAAVQRGRAVGPAGASGPVAGFRELAARGVVHFMGVGGAGMAPLAELVLARGGAVSGCDLRGGRAVDALAGLGIEFSEGHDPKHVAGAAAVVVTSAVEPGHPELAAAEAAGVPVFKRAAALGQWVAGGRVVGIAGTHGKTTTTAMAAHVLERAGADPTCLVGGEVTAWGGSLRRGRSEVFVVEADEYDRSFLTLRPEVAVVTNVEPDHLDTYGDVRALEAAFAEYAGLVRPRGTLWICADDPGAAALAGAGPERTRTFGFSQGAGLRAVSVRAEGRGSAFTAVEDGAPAGEFRVPAPGRHNVLNALAAAGAARSLGAQWRDVREGLAAFEGVGRRYEALGAPGGVQVVDDYAHHPTEVAATLAAARSANPGRRIVAVFQPHLYTRTRDCRDAFGRALAAADAVWVTDVFPAREEPIAGVTGETVAEAAAERGASVVYHPCLATLAAAVAGALRAGDVCVTMGAGSIGETARELVDALGERSQ